MPPKITRRQKEVLAFIKQFETEKEYGPSLKDVANQFNIAPPTASKLVSALSRKGFVLKTRDPVLGLVIEALSDTKRAESVLKVRGTVFASGEVNWYDEPDSITWCRPMLSSTFSDEVFGLYVRDDIPELFVRGGDFLLCHEFGEGDYTHLFPKDIAIIKNCLTPILTRFWGVTLTEGPLEWDFIDRRPLAEVESENEVHPVGFSIIDSKDLTIIIEPIVNKEEVRSVFDQWLQQARQRPQDVEFLGRVNDLFRIDFAQHPDEERIADFSRQVDV